MGLLTDPSAGQSRIIKILLQYHSKLGMVLYFGALLYFCLLAYEPFNSDTYISENALLPGLVKSEFRHENAAKLYHQELLDEMGKYSNAIPYPWLLAKFRQIGLDTYTHNFTLNYPLGKAQQQFSGKNVYAILHAPRAASTEALVLSVPYRPPSSIHLTTAPSIAILLAFAQFAVKQKYWAKDIIFLITEHEQLGMAAWLEAYHGIKSDVLNSGDLRARSGAIQAALNLEFHDTEIAELDIKIEGLNGQLPNLDLFNLVVLMGEKERLKITFKNRPNSYMNIKQNRRIRRSRSYQDDDSSNLWQRWRMGNLGSELSTWQYSLFTQLAMVFSQATGVPDGNHGLYFRYGVQALTLEGFGAHQKPISTWSSNNKNRKTAQTTVSSAGFYTMGRMIEGTFRSLNNLLERFHQSFFFYLLASSDRFISIGYYIPVICVLAAVLILKAYAEWCELNQEDDSEKNIATNSEKYNDETEKLDEGDVSEEESLEHLSEAEWRELFRQEAARTTNDSDVNKNVINFHLDYVIIVVLICHAYGFVLNEIPSHLTRFLETHFDGKCDTETAVTYMLGIAIVFGILLPWIGKLFYSRREYSKENSKDSDYSQNLLHIFAQLELGTCLICIAMFNASLAIIIATVFVPAALNVVDKSSSNKRTMGLLSRLRRLNWLFQHPFVLLFFAIIYYTITMFDIEMKSETLSDMISRSFDAYKKAIIFAIVDAKIYGNRTWGIVTCLLVSNWAMFWHACVITKETRPIIEERGKTVKELTDEQTFQEQKKKID